MSDKILFIGPGGETVTGPGEYFPPLLLAVHKRNGCGRVVAVYWHDDGWSAGGARCQCTPRPELPTGEELRRVLKTVKLGDKPRKIPV